MDSNDEDVFVVGAIENSEIAFFGHGRMNPPQKIVRQFLGCGALEGSHAATLRAHAGHHVADGAVLAAGVDALQYDQQSQLFHRVE